MTKSRYGVSKGSIHPQVACHFSTVIRDGVKLLKAEYEDGTICYYQEREQGQLVRLKEGDEMIKGLSERIRLPRLGKIRLGIKVNGDKSLYPKAVDYFVCPSAIQEFYGEKPKELPIMIPVEDIEQWASQFYRCYSASRGLICKGDGENATALVDTKTGEIATKDSPNTELRDIKCDPDTCRMMQANQCRPIMNLQFLIPKVPGLGVWQLGTSSINSIKNINSAAALIKGMCGRVSMIPLTLKLEKMEVSPEGKKKNIYVLSLTTSFSMENLISQLNQLPEGRALLPTAADAEPPDDLFTEEILTEEILTEHETPPESAPETENQAPAETASTIEPEEEKQESESFIDMAWLQEQIGILQKHKLESWSNKNIAVYLKILTGKNAKSVTEAVSYLTKEQAEDFTRKVQQVVELA